MACRLQHKLLGGCWGVWGVCETVRWGGGMEAVCLNAALIGLRTGRCLYAVCPSPMAAWIKYVSLL